MSDQTDTTTFTRDDYKGNAIFGVGIRALITLMLIIAVIVYQGYIIWIISQDPTEPLRIEEPLHSLVLLAVGYYFGQKNLQNKT